MPIHTGGAPRVVGEWAECHIFFFDLNFFLFVLGFICCFFLLSKCNMLVYVCKQKTVMRRKIRPIEEHEAYTHILAAMEHQEEGKWKDAIKSYKIGIALLEVTLNEIDRSTQKREWRNKV